MLVWQNKCPNNKKEIYNNKYKHTRDRLFDLSSPKTEKLSSITYHWFFSSAIIKDIWDNKIYIYA